MGRVHFPSVTLSHAAWLFHPLPYGVLLSLFLYIKRRQYNIYSFVVYHVSAYQKTGQQQIFLLLSRFFAPDRSYTPATRQPLRGLRALAQVVAPDRTRSSDASAAHSTCQRQRTPSLHIRNFLYRVHFAVHQKNIVTSLL